jgi:serine/threonine-protein kinase
MAEVLLALQDAGGGVNKVVVIKRIWPDLATDRDFLMMFRDEARLAIRLNHPNVVQTLEVVEDADQLAIAMEYLHGQPLHAILNHHLTGSQQLGLSLRLRILVDVLAGLQHAHELTDYDGSSLGVVHRDVNPHNVFITYDGQVKLMDFGVAKTVAAAYQTRPGAIKGKLAYLAPEYLRSDVVDRRADVFAVGVMLWEMLTGQRLWQGLSEAQIVHQLAAAVTAPMLPADPTRPPALDAICARALAMNPGERYATAADLETELQQVLAGSVDSHARSLGRVVTHAFAAARAEREALIARALEAGLAGHAAAPGSGASREALWTKESDYTREVNWKNEVDAFLSAADDMLDVTVVDPTVPPEPEPERPRVVVPPPPPPPARARPRIGGAIATVAICATVLTLVAQEMHPGAPTPAPPTAHAAAVPLAPAAPPLPSPLPPVAPPTAVLPAPAPPTAVLPAPAPPTAVLPTPAPPTAALPVPAAAAPAAAAPAPAATAEPPTFAAVAAKPSTPPPSLVAGEMSALRLHAEQLSLGQSQAQAQGQGIDQKASAGHHRRLDRSSKQTAAVRVDAPPAPAPAPAAESLRPASQRAIDEGDPYK